MSNTYTQVHLQIIFAVKGRQSLIPLKHREELNKYVTGIVEKRNQKLIAVNNYLDHIHIFVGYGTTITIADLVHDVKIASTNFINKKNWTRGHFYWQEGYGCFSYSRSQVDKVVKYILNQQNHHKKITLKEEYINFLKKFEVLYDTKYLFDWIEINETDLV